MEINHISTPTSDQMKELWKSVDPRLNHDPADKRRLYVSVIVPADKYGTGEITDWDNVRSWDGTPAEGWTWYEGWVMGMGEKIALTDVETRQLIEDVRFSWVCSVSRMTPEDYSAGKSDI